MVDGDETHAISEILGKLKNQDARPCLGLCQYVCNVLPCVLGALELTNLASFVLDDN